MLRIVRAGLGLAVVLAAAPELSAQPGMMTPGSALIFPLVDYGPNARTIVTVTNANTSTVVCGGGFRVGDVRVHFLVKNGANCFVFERFHSLTPGDTVSFRLDEFAPGGSGEDWLLVEAQDVDTQRAIDFDYLIGSAQLGEAHPNQKWWYGAYSFRSLAAENGSPFGTSTCGHAFSGPPNDPDLDFDGIEYAGFPKVVMLDFFVGEGTPPELPGGTSVESRLVLMAPAAGPTRVTTRIRNNNEVQYNIQFEFSCLVSTTLVDQSQLFSEGVMRQNYDARELGGLPTGWISMSGTNGILGVFVQRAIRDRKVIQGFGRALHFDGVRTDVVIPR